MTPANRSRGIALKDGMHAAFPTPLLVKRYGDDALNRRIVDHVASREAREASLGMSNVGGWHSPPDLLDADDPAIVELRARVAKCLQSMLANTSFSDVAADRRMRITAWANVARDGAYNAVHNHTPAVYSGVYYASIGDPPPEGSRDGLIEFVDPRPGPHGGALPTHALHAPLVIDPEPGMLVIFPGWLLHYVHPYRGATPRISIAFNLWLDVPPARD
jgi:uncharacterized protein (TIGR02466 family)